MVKNHQTVKICREINTSSSSYSGSYLDNDIAIRTDFLSFKHTDGLNYLNLELRYTHRFHSFKKITINHLEWFEIGILIPNIKLLNKNRYDEFRLLGCGLTLVLA